MVLAAAQAGLKLAVHSTGCLHAQVGAIDAFAVQGALEQSRGFFLRFWREGSLKGGQGFEGGRALAKAGLPRGIDVEILAAGLRVAIISWEFSKRSR